MKRSSVCDVPLAFGDPSANLVVFEEAAEEVEAQLVYYREHAGENVALRLINAIEAAYDGLLEGRIVGVNHRRMKYRRPLKRVLLARFPFAVVYL
jgi:plasmid stabilization system protein ParE